jgi:hypothetical protein
MLLDSLTQLITTPIPNRPCKHNLLHFLVLVEWVVGNCYKKVFNTFQHVVIEHHMNTLKIYKMLNALRFLLGLNVLEHMVACHANDVT